MTSLNKVHIEISCLQLTIAGVLSAISAYTKVAFYTSLEHGEHIPRFIAEITVFSKHHAA